MSGSVEFPTSDEIAVAIVTAARFHGEDSIETVTGTPGLRGRWIAVFALIDIFPDVPSSGLALKCGFLAGAAAQITGQRNRVIKLSWWRAAHLKKVKGKIVDAITSADALLRNPIAINESVNAIIEPEPSAPTFKEYLSEIREKYEPKDGPLIENEPLDLPRLVLPPPKIFDRSVGAPLSILDQQIEAKTEVEPGINLFNITDDELRRQPPELVEQLSAKVRAHYKALMAPVEKADPQPNPKSEPECQPEPAICKPEEPTKPVLETERKPAPSSAAQALASFQRTREDAKVMVSRGSSANPPASPVLVPNGKKHIPIAERVAKVQREEAIRTSRMKELELWKGAGSSQGCVAGSMRPDAPAEQRGAVPLPPSAYGDPDPDWRARRAAAEVLIKEEEDKVRRLNRGTYDRLKAAHKEEDA